MLTRVHSKKSISTMGRKQDGGGDHNLSVKVPSFFRCPISLDVMKSPVSLCTGVTYDRSSIKRWLDSGNNTCPATMQPLPSTDLVPNLTLQRLINLWAHTGPPGQPTMPRPARSLLAEIRSDDDPTPSLRRLADFFDGEDADDFEKNQLINAGGCAEILASLLLTTNNSNRIETLEEVVRVLARVLISDCIDKENKQIVAAAAAANRNLNESVSSLIRVLTDGRSVESRANASAVIDAVVTSVSAESKVLIAEKRELIPELIRLIATDDESKSKAAAIDAGLSCLVSLAGVRRARVRMVRSGIVPVLTRILAADDVSPAAAKKAMKLMEGASGCRDGREAICEGAEATISAILKRMMKAGREGTEAAVVVVWSVCHLFRDRRAQEAVEASGGLTKILLLMQSDCSPAVRQMAGDLLKIFKVNAKCCLAGYDTKTTHIMPF